MRAAGVDISGHRSKHLEEFIGVDFERFISWPTWVAIIRNRTPNSGPPHILTVGMALAVGTRLGPHRVESLLGHGGMGEVYLARDTRLGRLVAIKVLPETLARDLGSRDRFQREARAIASLSHPHICTLFDVGQEREMPYLVMEFVEGPTLQDCLREGPLPVDRAVRSGAQIGAALGAAHAGQIVHRDLKPANIKLTAGGVKVLDFGLAKFAGSDGSAHATPDQPTLLVTKRHALLGTAAYMSPEQARGAGLDRRTDLWSLGVVLWEMLTGRGLFARETMADSIAAVLHAPVDLAALPAVTPGAVRELLGRLLDRNAETRLADASVAASVLEAASAGRGAQVSAGLAPAPTDAERKSVLVLPFANSSPDPGNEYLSDGFTEEVIADLSRIAGLRVTSRSTAMRLKGTTKDLATLAEEFGAHYALEGSVRRAGSSLRITAQLVEPRADRTLWAEKFSGTLDDIFVIQERVARAIVEALRVKLSAAEAEEIAPPSKPNAFAYDTYLRARRDIWSFQADGLERAERELRHALDVAGEDAVLYAGLGLVQWQYVNAGISGDRGHLDQAREYARKVIELDPTSARGPWILGLAAQQSGDLVGSIRNMEHAVAIDPHDPDQLVWLAIGWTHAGRRSRARPIFEKLLTTDPLFDLLMWGLGFDAHLACEWSRAEAFYDKGRQLTPEHPAGACVLAQVAASTGDLERMARIVDELGHDPASHPLAALTHIFKHSLLGEADAADRLATAAWEASIWNDFQYTWIMAQAQVALGRKEAALRWLERATESGFIHHPFLHDGDPLLCSLRGDPGFEALMARVERRWRSVEQEIDGG